MLLHNLGFQFELENRYGHGFVKALLQWKRRLKLDSHEEYCLLLCDAV
jgi:hypothetical protein